MKRIVAALLCGTMVLSLAGCSKSSEETKKKTKKSKKTTTETTEETAFPTEDPTAETPTDSTETSESETSAPENVFVLDNSLETLGLNYPIEYWDFTSAFSPADEETDCIFLGIDQLFFEDGSPYDKLQTAIMNDLSESMNATSEKYKTTADAFLQDAKAGKPVESNEVEFRTALFRSDSQVFSFAVTSSADLKENEFRAYNYRSSDGSRITLDDVVLDRSALAGYVDKLFNLPGADSEYKSWLTEIENSINDGSFVFTMSYDSINFLRTAYGTINYDVYKIPVIGHEDIFNMEYFGKTPTYYTIFDDANSEIIWDVNLDGDMDSIKSEVIYSEGTSEYGGDEFILEVNYNGNKFNSKTAGIDITGHSMLPSMVMKTDSGFYYYARMLSIDSFEDTYVFKIENSELAYVGKFEDFMCSRTFIDPDDFEMRDICDTLGTKFYTNAFSVIGNNGMPMFKYDLWTSDSTPVTAKIDIPCAKVNEIDYTKVEDTTIKAGSFVRPYLYDMQTRRLIVAVENGNPNETFYAEINFAKDQDYNITVDGKSLEDVFYSIIFWG